MQKSREGQNVPNVTFPIRVNDEWQKVSSDDLFKGKTVVLFGLPGAFTPTCSSRHLPRYNELVGVFKANGIDSVICLSVNDPFVMETWKAEQNAEDVGGQIGNRPRQAQLALFHAGEGWPDIKNVY